jgi:hypothetical protein
MYTFLVGAVGLILGKLVGLSRRTIVIPSWILAFLLVGNKNCRRDQVWQTLLIRHEASVLGCDRFAIEIGQTDRIDRNRWKRCKEGNDLPSKRNEETRL